MDLLPLDPEEKPNTGSGHNPSDQPVSNHNQEVTMSIEKVSDEVNKIILSWGSQPNSGYRITIDRIDFNAAGEATVYYNLHYPEPDQMYTQMIAEPKAETYVSSAYKPVIEELMNSVQGSAGAGVSSFDIPVQSIVH